MARANNSTKPDVNPNPASATSNQNGSSEEGLTQDKFDYIGPAYVNGIVIKGYPKPLKLKDFTKAEAQAFVKKPNHEKYARYWTGL